MKIHDYSPGNGTLYRLGFDSTDYSDMLLVWLNPTGRKGGLCVDLGSYPNINWDTLQSQLDVSSYGDVAAILGWLIAKWGFTGRMPPEFNAQGMYEGS